jgi:hypothetical protein
MNYYLGNKTLELLIYLLFQNRHFVFFDNDVDKDKFYKDLSSYKEYNAGDFLEYSEEIESGEILKSITATNTELLDNFVRDYIESFEKGALKPVQNGLIAVNCLSFENSLSAVVNGFEGYYAKYGKNFTISSKYFSTANTEIAPKEVDYELKYLESLLYLEKKKFISINECTINHLTFYFNFNITLLKPPKEILKDLGLEFIAVYSAKTVKIQAKPEKIDIKGDKILSKSEDYILYENRVLECNGFTTLLPDNNIKNLCDFVLIQNNKMSAEPDEIDFITYEDIIEQTSNYKKIKRNDKYANRCISRLRAAFDEINPTDYTKLPSIGKKTWKIKI